MVGPLVMLMQLLKHLSRHCEVSLLAAAVSCGDLIKTALKKAKLILYKVKYVHKDGKLKKKTLKHWNTRLLE